MEKTTKTPLEQYQAAQTAAAAIIASFTQAAADTPDAVAELRASLESLSKKELVEKCIELSKVKTNSGVKVEDVVKALLTNEDCAILPYDSIAQLVVEAIPTAETSAKSVASYFSKKGAEWGAVKRVRLNLNPMEILKQQAAAASTNAPEDQVVNQ